MTLDSSLLIAFLALVVRIGAMFVAAPLFGGANTPPSVRALLSIAIGMALCPLLAGHVAVPGTLYDLGTLVFREVSYGLLIGFCVQSVLLVAEIAGSFLDFHLGLGLSAALNPIEGIPSSTLSKFKYTLALVLLLAVNGHHIPIRALLYSFEVSSQLNLASSFTVVMNGLAHIGVAAIQIALPVAAVGFVVDVALAVVNRAVPQINILMSGISAKILAGMIALSVALPGLAHGIDASIEYMARSVQQLTHK